MNRSAHSVTSDCCIDEKFSENCKSCDCWAVFQSILGILRKQCDTRCLGLFKCDSLWKHGYAVAMKYCIRSYIVRYGIMGIWDGDLCCCRYCFLLNVSLCYHALIVFWFLNIWFLWVLLMFDMISHYYVNAVSHLQMTFSCCCYYSR